ncbi:MAG: transglycosylase domain-containing protein, partial [Pseudomonadota bacterium]
MITVRQLHRTAMALAIMLVALMGLDRLFPPPLERAAAQSVMVTDRNGKPLRAFPTDEGRWRFAADLDRIDPLFVDALITVEDKRFYRHVGVDGLALVRAALSAGRAGRIVSGGST